MLLVDIQDLLVRLVELFRATRPRLRSAGAILYLFFVTHIRILAQPEPLGRLCDADTTRDAVLHRHYELSFLCDVEVLVGKSEEGDLWHRDNSLVASDIDSPRYTPRQHRSVDLRARSTMRATPEPGGGVNNKSSFSCSKVGTVFSPEGPKSVVAARWIQPDSHPMA